ncbi:hypothetical protein [Bradyrhizobium genosp. A]|uniref:hypothetical protein n=1 Tax=Bradyrhizobium genosp. A TaxID=83626 RepID=UPI003CF2E9A5
MMSDLDTISAGREAWQRICQRGEKTFEDWTAIGKALALGRAHCLKLAETNKPFGKRYTAAMTLWLETNGLDGIHQQERWWALKVIDNLGEIDKWRASLDPASKRRWNHPQSAWDNWRRSQGHVRPRSSSGTESTFKRHPRAGDRMIHWPQDHLRRAANAIRECRSMDCIVMARAALEAAIQSEADLYALLDAKAPCPATRPTLADAPALATV